MTNRQKYAKHVSRLAGNFALVNQNGTIFAGNLKPYQNGSFYRFYSPLKQGRQVSQPRSLLDMSKYSTPQLNGETFHGDESGTILWAYGKAGNGRGRGKWKILHLITVK